MPETHRADGKRFQDERFAGEVAPNHQNYQTLLEKPVRERITDSLYYKQECFALNASTILDRAVNITFIGGTYGDAQRPSPFLCLIHKMLEFGMDGAMTDDILREYLDHGGEKFKYLRALALFYIRLTRPAKQVYQWLEPYLEDKRKLKRRTRTGVTLTYMDEFVDDLLTKPRVCATTLWQMSSRAALEDFQDLEPRVSPLGDIDDLLDDDEDDEEMANGDDSDGRRGDSPGSEFGEIHEDGEGAEAEAGRGDKEVAELIPSS